MRKPAFSLSICGLGACMLVLAGCATDPPTPAPIETEDADLVGGALATEGQFPSTLLVRNNCTVSRVGPRQILTAAHCVVDAEGRALRPTFATGATIELSTKVDLDRRRPAPDALRRVRIAAVHVMPGYLEARSPIGVLTDEALPDVAIMELDATSEAMLTDVPIATVDMRPVAPSEPIVIMGYGCEAGVQAVDERTRSRLRYRKTTAIPKEQLLHPGSTVAALDTTFATNLVAQYFFSPGHGKREEEASLCPGDSGGPVYRDTPEANLVVGVNAYYSFRSRDVDPNRVSMTNWHTRLDPTSRFNVGSWLAARGARVLGRAGTFYSMCDAQRRFDSPMVCNPFAEYARTHRPEVGEATAAARWELRGGTRAWLQRFERGALRFDGGVVTFGAGACVARTNGRYCIDAKRFVRCSDGVVEDTVTCATACVERSSGRLDQATCSDPDDGASSRRTDDVADPPPFDRCSEATVPDGRHCASTLGSGESSILVQCVDHSTFGSVLCPRGCEVVTPGPDRCR